VVAELEDFGSHTLGLPTQADLDGSPDIRRKQDP
jgi:hypothetical protein